MDVGSRVFTLGGRRQGAGGACDGHFIFPPRTQSARHRHAPAPRPRAVAPTARGRGLGPPRWSQPVAGVRPGTWEAGDAGKTPCWARRGRGRVAQRPRSHSGRRGAGAGTRPAAAPAAVSLGLCAASGRRRRLGPCGVSGSVGDGPGRRGRQPPRRREHTAALLAPGVRPGPVLAAAPRRLASCHCVFPALECAFEAAAKRRRSDERLSLFPNKTGLASAAPFCGRTGVERT